MTLVNVKHKPFEQNFNNWMDDFFTPLSSIYKSSTPAPTVNSGVPVNVTENEGGYQLQVVAPGFEKEAFEIKLEETLLTIAASPKTEAAENSGKKLRSEFQFKPFKRSFTLDENIDAENIAAEYKNGVLLLNLPRKATVKPTVKNIAIQ